MANNSKIEWTDATWNLISGCTACSPGCEHCYARMWGLVARDVVFIGLAAVGWVMWAESI